MVGNMEKILMYGIVAIYGITLAIKHTPETTPKSCAIFDFITAFAIVGLIETVYLR